VDTGEGPEGGADAPHDLINQLYQEPQAQKHQGFFVIKEEPVQSPIDAVSDLFANVQA
jgi:hypothetical protein